MPGQKYIPIDGNTSNKGKKTSLVKFNFFSLLVLISHLGSLSGRRNVLAYKIVAFLILHVIFLFTYGIPRDNTMDDKMMYILKDDKQNYPFYRLKL